MKTLEKDETLCIQSGEPVYVAKHMNALSRLVIANANLVSAWTKQEIFDTYEDLGLTMYGQTSAGKLDLYRHSGCLSKHLRDLCHARKKAFQAETLKGKLVLTAGMGGMSGAQPWRLL